MNAPATDFPILAMDRTRALAVLKSSLFPGASDDSVLMVLSWCEARGVDPMDKPCHIVPMWDSKSEQMRDVIMPSVDYYRQKAESTNEYIGLSDTDYGPDIESQLGEVKLVHPSWARVVVRRLVQGHVAEFPAKVFWLETYATRKKNAREPNAMWLKRTYGQLEKCAEALALRRAFPKLCGGPTAEEMQGKIIEDVVIDAERAPPERARATVESDEPQQGQAAEKPAPASQIKYLRQKIAQAGKDEIDVLAHFNLTTLDGISVQVGNEIAIWLRG